jgi:molybdopterin molybdotransferase
MISFEQALQAVRSQVPSLAQEQVACRSAVGRVLSQDLTAPTCLPAFTNAAMDGFALHEKHLQQELGSAIAVSRLQSAGDAAFEMGQAACQIMTGAVLPAGAVAVVPIEQVEVQGDLHASEGMQIRLHEVPVFGQNIRKAGEDVQAGQTLFVAGTVLQARHVMLLAALGIERIPVHAPLKAGIICTGAELRSDGGPLLSGQIRNSNGAYLQAALPSMHAEPVYRRDIADDPTAYLQAVREAEQAGCQLIISTGAVSMGVHDFVPQALAMAGAEIVFHKLRMRPGKPTLFARLPSGALLFGLPGNPMSCAVGLRFFVNAAIRAMQHRPLEVPQMAQLQHRVNKKPDWCLIHKAQIAVSEQAVLKLSVLAGQESFRIAPFVQANAWVVLPESADRIEAGSLLPCFAMECAQWLEMP